MDRLKAVPYDRAPYTKYPGLKDILKNNPALPIGNKIGNNVQLGSSMALAASVTTERTNIQVGWSVPDSLLKNFDSWMKSHSKELPSTFRRIPVEKIGIQ